MTPDELIALLERGAKQGIDPRRVLRALGFRLAEAAGNEAALGRDDASCEVPERDSRNRGGEPGAAASPSEV